jgi:hypothetical protein
MKVVVQEVMVKMEWVEAKE